MHDPVLLVWESVPDETHLYYFPFNSLAREDHQMLLRCHLLFANTESSAEDRALAQWVLDFVQTHEDRKVIPDEDALPPQVHVYPCASCTVIISGVIL
jgi:hypothetical protein